MRLEISPSKKLTGEIGVPGDKSISHRAIMTASLSDGECYIKNLLGSEDCLRTVECFRAMGIEIEKASFPGETTKTSFAVKGKGPDGLCAPKDILYVGNSGTTIRLLLGILSGRAFHATLTGDESIKKRPMLRVVEPLRLMGASIHGRENGNFVPIEIKGGGLKAVSYDLPVASAQIKSCLMYAALSAEGITAIKEPAASRDHTERMFEYFDIPFRKDGNTVSIGKFSSIRAKNLDIPGDISSAAFFMAAASVIPESRLLIRNVGLNPSRTGIIDVLLEMGADIEVQNETVICAEPRGDILIKSGKLNGIELSGGIIPRIIDEIPVIAVAAAKASGTTTIRDAKELRVKESDRIRTVASELQKLGVKVEELEDGLIIHGGSKFKGAICDSHGDHRIAMALAVAGLAAEDEVVIEDTDCIETSFPGFEKVVKGLAS